MATPENYFVNLYAFPVGFAAILVLLVGIIGFLHNARSLKNLFFSLACLSVFIWLSGFFMIYSSRNPALALSWYKYYGHLGVVTVAPNMYFFVKQLVKSSKNLARQAGIVYSLAFIFYLLGFNPNFVVGAKNYFWGWYPLFGPLAYPFFAFFFGLVFLTFRDLWFWQGKLDSKIENKGIRVVFISVLLGYFAAFDFLPTLKIGVYPFGHLNILVWLSIIGYAIIRYKLMVITPAVVADEVVSTIPDLLILVDTEGEITLANPAIEKTLGYRSDELIGRPVGEIIPQKDTLNSLFRDLKKKTTINNLETIYRSKDGRSIPVIFSGSVIRNAAGDTMGYVITALDITERKKAEEEREALLKELQERQALLEKQRQEAEEFTNAIKNVASDLMDSRDILEYQKTSLEEVNKELDDFTYIVSHDLKEPLRSIDAYSKFIEDDYKDKLNEEGRHYLERVRANTERMKRLIEDLLELSRLKKKGSVIEEIPAGDLISEARMRLEYAIKQKNAEIIVQDNLPRVFCDRVRLTEVFLNLISNAIKFNDKPKPVIEIGYSDKGDLYEFYVKDNGPGIEKEYFEKIFEIFQRLGRREDAEGTGAGLTIAKKIVHIHRGDIWVDSKLKEGSVFYFTIPKNKEMVIGKKLIGEILLEKNLITEENLKAALEEQKKSSVPHKKEEDQ